MAHRRYAEDQTTVVLQQGAARSFHGLPALDAASEGVRE